MNNVSIRAAVCALALGLVALGCSSVPEEEASGGLPSDTSAGKDPATRSSSSAASPPKALPRLTSRAIDSDDQLPESGAVFAQIAGALYTGDAAVVVTQASTNAVYSPPAGASASDAARRSGVQTDTVELSMNVGNGEQQLSFSVRLTEKDSKALFSSGELLLDDSNFAALSQGNGQQIVRVTKLSFERLPSGADQIVATFGAADQAVPMNLPDEVTFKGALRLVCSPAAKAGEVHSMLDDPMLRSPFCQAKARLFALQAFAP